jgi:hypothetical protein
VLGHRGGGAAGPGGERDARGGGGVHRAEDRAVGEVHREADLAPAATAGDALAEQLGVVVLDAEHLHVERLLRGPDASGDGSGKCSSCGLCAIDRHGVKPHCNGGDGPE